MHTQVAAQNFVFSTSANFWEPFCATSGADLIILIAGFAKSLCECNEMRFVDKYQNLRNLPNWQAISWSMTWRLQVHLCHSRSYPTTPDLRSYHFFILFIWTMQRWILYCPCLPIFGNCLCTPPVLIWSLCLCPHNYEKINTRTGGSVQSGGGQQSIAFKCKSCREISWQHGFIQVTQHAPFGARDRMPSLPQILAIFTF